MASFVGGRPRASADEAFALRATSRRCQARIASGEAIVARSLRSLRPSRLPLTASRRRWRSVSFTRRMPRASRRIRFSSFRYAIELSWFRSDQPARARSVSLME